MGKRYSETEQKKFVARIDAAVARGQELEEACKELGISTTSYYRWVRNVKENGQYAESLQEEVERLRLENTKLREKLGAILLERELSDD